MLLHAIFIVASFSLAAAKLILMTPQGDETPHYSLANFGHIPYGKTLTGSVFLPREELDQRFDLCNRTNYLKFEKQTDIWLISRRGNCSFTTKAINAQLLGAKMLLVVDNHKEQVERVVMSDDGQGYQVYIPTAILNITEGDRMIEILQAHAKAGNPNKSVVVGVMEFNISERVEKVSLVQDQPHVTLGLTFETRETYKLLRDFQDYYRKLQGYATFDIFYHTEACSDCKKQNFTSQVDDCLGGGRYCVEKPDSRSNGVDVLQEYLRQVCLWTIDPEKWFEYMDYFDLECVESASQYRDCYSKKIKGDLASQVQSCVDKSFDVLSSPVSENKILQQQRSMTQNSGIVFYPGALVNLVAFRGNLDADNLLEDICSGILSSNTLVMINPAPVCSTSQLNTDEGSNASSSSVHVGMIIFVVIAFLLFGLFLFYCYRRRLKQEAQNELKDQVNEMVSQYIKFYETKQS